METILIPFLQMVDIENYNNIISLLQSNKFIADKYLKRIPLKAVDEIIDILIKHEIPTEEAVVITMTAIEKYKYFYKR